MPSFELEESEYAGPIPEDTVLAAELVACKIVEKNYLDDDGNKVRKVEFKFVIQEEGSPWEGENIWGETPTRFNTHPDCKLKNWAAAIAATEFPAGYRLDTDVLIGMKCRVVTGSRTYEKDGETKTHHFVNTVLPARAPAGASSF